MNKTDLLNIYRPLFTIHFYDDAFMMDKNIKIVEQKLSLKEMMNFYVLRTEKKGLPDGRGIEQRINDLSSKHVTLGVVRKKPKKWDLELQHRTIPQVGNIRSIPIATDLSKRRTLILDSNHLLSNLSCSDDTPVPVVQIIGSNLENVVPDFIILNRQ